MSVVAQRVKRVLDQHFVCYETVPHVTDFTALETAEHAHISGRAFAKAVIVVADGKIVMVVVPAHHRVDLDMLRVRLHAKHVKLAREWRIRRLFPDCDLGAIPPFGSLYDLPVVISPNLATNETIAFNAGSHEMVITISYADYERLVKPTVLRGISRRWQA